MNSLSRATRSEGSDDGSRRVSLFAAPRAVMVAGPTASGKSRFALRLAEKFGGVVISADSMQIYRGLDIGTAKESAVNRARVPHELIDIVDADKSFSVSEFASAAQLAAEKTLKDGRIPVVVGGTGLYFESLVRPLGFGGTPSDETLRAELSALYDEKGGENLLEMLRGCDSATAARLHPNDKKRIVRALEIVSLTFLSLLGENAQSMQAIGYKEFAPFMSEYREKGAFSDKSLVEIAESIKKNTRNYAKRQITWFKRYPFAEWFETGDLDAAEKYVMSRLSDG